MMTRTLLTGHPLSQFTRDVDRLFESFFGGPAGVVRPGVTAPALNVWQDGERVHAEAELPGVAMGDVEIYATGDTLTLRGTRTIQYPEDARVLRSERAGGSFERSVRLPCEIDVENVEATMRDGVLRISMPKAARAQARRIEIKALGDGS